MSSRKHSLTSSGGSVSSTPASSPGATVLYYNPASIFSRRVLVALFEKKAEFERVSLNLMEGEQFQDWFLELNPKGEVPVLKRGEKVIVDSTEILEFVDKNYGRPYLLFPHENTKVRSYLEKINAIPMFPLTYGIACFHPHGITKLLRWPYCTYDFAAWRKVLQRRPEVIKNHAARFIRSNPAVHKQLELKAKHSQDALAVFEDRNKIKSIIDNGVETLLDEVERDLSNKYRPGPWLCGHWFSAADIALTMLLIRLYQLGLDDVLWKNGARPNLAAYQELAFRRPSVEKATNWSAHSLEEVKVVTRYEEVPNATPVSPDRPVASSPVEKEKDRLAAARLGLGAIVVLGGIYAARKFFFRK